MKTRILLSCFMLSFILGGCKMRLSMSGVDLGTAKTVSVNYFLNNSSLAKPTYCSTLTESLKDALTSQSPLSLAAHGGDLQFEGSVTGYAVTPIAISSGTDQAAMNRLTITVSVKFTNNVDEKKNFETSFSRFADFSSQTNLNSVEDQLIKTINDQLVQDIFNKALINW